MTPEERFWVKVDLLSGDCWLWTAGCTSNGTGSFKANGRCVSSPRHAWELTVGPVPAQHRLIYCKTTKRCVNPAHMRLISLADWSDYIKQHVPRQDTCQRGHKMTPDNIFARTNDPKQRECRTCKKEGDKRRGAAWKQKRRILRDIDRTAHWSPNIQRWLIWEGHRWVRGSDQDARQAIRRHLAAAGTTAGMSETEELAAVHATRRQVMALHPALEEEAA